MKNTLIKKISAVSMTAFLAAGLAACGAGNTATPTDGAASGAAEASTDESGLTDITFCLDWTPNTNHTGIYVAQQMGYYKDAGLNVQIVQPPEDGSALMCAAGQAQFAVEAQDTMAPSIDSDSPLGISAVAAILQHNTSGILSRAGEGLDKPAGLTGKTYSTWEAPVELATLEQVITDDGGDFSQVNLIPNDITDEPAALAAHQTDAIWVFYGWGGINADIENVDCDFFYFKDINPAFDYYTPVIIGNNEFMESNPDVAKAFLDATKKGYEYAIENPKEAADMLIAGDDTGSLRGCEDLVYASQEYLSTQYVADASRWGYIDPERWNGFYAWLAEHQLTNTDLTGKGFNNDYLPE